MKLFALFAALALGASPALAADSLTPAQPLPVQPSGGAPASGAGGGVASGTIANLLTAGYEIKAAFVNANISYVFLQKGPSAFMCKSVAGSLCEKLN
jgi:hypothetical protein